MDRRGHGIEVQVAFDGPDGRTAELLLAMGLRASRFWWPADPSTSWRIAAAVRRPAPHGPPAAPAA
ncbi:hypothetical protein [Streptomyces sp. TS71-3]|uniref:hypothetical protein n=1 Tax=Streptomyces sp. TS71-3 TaxID=2733862 RepID=UPI001B0E4F38|nr:hypothetical protein [Streptomyces sp. TS71-3]GHJ41131.1 hypothetical protein Sm713_67400 [Streptomyces sp. TS71-3]